MKPHAETVHREHEPSDLRSASSSSTMWTVKSSGCILALVVLQKGKTETGAAKFTFGHGHLSAMGFDDPPEIDKPIPIPPALVVVNGLKIS